MALDEMNTGNSGNCWGLIIFLLILFYFFTGGGFGGFASRGAGCYMMDDVGLVHHGDCNTANVTKAIRDMQDDVNANVIAATNQLAMQSRLQYDAQQGEKMFDLKLNALATQQNYEAKLAAKDATIERMTLAQKMTDQFNILQSEIAAIRCNMLTKPQITGVGAVCPNAGIINGLGLTGGIAGACGNSYSGTIY